MPAISDFQVANRPDPLSTALRIPMLNLVLVSPFAQFFHYLPHETHTHTKKHINIDKMIMTSEKHTSIQRLSINLKYNKSNNLLNRPNSLIYYNITLHK